MTEFAVFAEQSDITVMSEGAAEASWVLCEVDWGEGERQQFTEAGFFVRSIWLGQVYSPVWSKLVRERAMHTSEGENTNMQGSHSVILLFLFLFFIYSVQLYFLWILFPNMTKL